MFREVNRSVREVAAEFGLDGERAEFLCECGDLKCSQTLRLTFEEYDSSRSLGALFLLAPGHEDPSAERVVFDNARFLIVEKLGEDGVAAKRPAGD